ncbi:F-box family protein, partial [Prunus dulcis]
PWTLSRKTRSTRSSPASPPSGHDLPLTLQVLQPPPDLTILHTPHLHPIASLNLLASALLTPHHRHVSSLPASTCSTRRQPMAQIQPRFSSLPLSHPVASSHGFVYLWGESPDSPESTKSLVVCNPLTRQFRVLPQLGSAWSRHGSVLVDTETRVMVLTELAALYFSGSNQWLKFSSNLPSKPRSPILVFDSVYALCDVGSPWRSQWKLFHCTISKLKTSQTWTRLEKHEWGDVFDILKRPRLVRGNGNKVLMVGGLKSSCSLNASCSTISILRLDLDSLEWDEAGRMPVDMFRCFQESSKFKGLFFRPRELGSWLCGTIVRGKSSGGGLMVCLEAAMGFAGGLFLRPGSLHCFDRVQQSFKLSMPTRGSCRDNCERKEEERSGITLVIRITQVVLQSDVRTIPTSHRPSASQ